MSQDGAGGCRPTPPSMAILAMTIHVQDARATFLHRCGTLRVELPRHCMYTFWFVRSVWSPSYRTQKFGDQPDLSVPV
jgi:hypothetical protein